MTDQFCRYFQRRQCTGCTRLHDSYPAQLAGKDALVRAYLGPVLAAAGAKLLPIVASPAPMGYRSSVKLCLHGDREGREAIGLYRLGSKDVAGIPGCPAQTAAVNRLVGRLFPRGARRPAYFYNHRGRVFQKNRLKFLTVRSGAGAQSIIISHTGVPRDVLGRWLTASGFGGLCAYESKLTPRDGDLPVGYHVAHLSGPLHMPVQVAGQTFGLAPTAFFQANDSLSPALIAGATSFQRGGDVLLDLYGGFGAYSFAAARRFARLLVVDGNAAAVDAANRAAAASSLPVVAFAATCEEFLANQLTPDDARRVTHVLVNPPRGGLSRQASARLSPNHLPGLKELHYVSCSPETLARDLTLLAGQGLVLRDAQPYDMFPQTDHVEVVARLRRVGA